MKDKILILRTIKYSESDLIVHALNPRGERINFIAKGALKSRRRFGGGILEPTHYVAVEYQESRSRGQSDSSEEPLHILQEASLVRDFPGLRENYDRLEAGLSLLQAVAKVAQFGSHDASRLFDLLGNALALAEESEHLRLLKLQFLTKLLYLEGVLSSDVGYKELLMAPLKKHEDIILAEDLLARLEWQVQNGMDRYVHGLNPTDSNSLE